MKFADDYQMILTNSAFNSDDEIKKLDENINKLKVCGSRRGSLESKSPTSCSKVKCGRPANPVPRHKRDSHIKAEYKRRDKIQKGFDILREIVPALENCSSKESKSSMLFKSAEHCRQLKVECKTQQDEALALRHEIESLGNQIHILQGKLPAVGVKVLEKSNNEMDIHYSEYIKKKSKENWKFWTFSLLLKPLFETYKKAMEGTTSEIFVDAVGRWVEENLSLVNLRPAILAALRKVCTKTKIIDKPEEFKKDVLEQISHLGDVNQNDATTNDVENDSIFNCNQSRNKTKSALSYNKESSPQSILSEHQPSLMSNMYPSSVMSKISNTLPHLDETLPDHANSDLSFQSHITSMTIEQKEDISHAIPHDIPMTSMDLWDIPVTLPSTDSSSSISDMIFTTSEENSLYDSILNSLCNTDSSSCTFSTLNDQLNVHSFQDLSDLTNDLFPACTTTSTSCHNSATFPAMITRQDVVHQPVDTLPFPSLPDLEMVQTTMESSVDPVSFLLESKAKFHLNHNTDSFS